MRKENHLKNKLIDDFLNIIGSINGVTIVEKNDVSGTADTGIDIVIEARVQGGRWVIPVEVKKLAYPRDLRQTIWNFDRFREAHTDNRQVVPVFIADFISEGARDTLKSHGVGFYDSSGSFYLNKNQYLIDIQRPHLTTKKTEAIDLFTDAREMVIHALLQHRGAWFSGEELSSLSETSSFTVSGVLRELELREWVVKSGEGGRLQRRRLVEPGALLDAWAEARRKRTSRRDYGYLFASDAHLLAKKIEKKMGGEAKFSWAFTGALAANETSPLLTGINIVDIVLPTEYVEEFIGITGIKRADEGYNVVLHCRSGTSLQFLKPYGDAWVTSDIIQYLDLLDGRGRNAELATQFRRHILEI
jgi:hypothetical protein